MDAHTAVMIKLIMIYGPKKQVPFWQKAIQSILVANIYGKYDEDLAALGLEDDTMIKAWDAEESNWVLPKFVIDKKELKMMEI